jgi:hypothetical protein
MTEHRPDQSDWTTRPTVEEMNQYTATAIAILASHLHRLEVLGDAQVGPELQDEIGLLVELTEANQRTVMGVVSELTRLAGLSVAVAGRLADRPPLAVLQSIAPVTYRDNGNTDEHWTTRLRQG